MASNFQLYLQDKVEGSNIIDLSGAREVGISIPTEVAKNLGINPHDSIILTAESVRPSSPPAPPPNSPVSPPADPLDLSNVVSLQEAIKKVCFSEAQVVPTTVVCTASSSVSFEGHSSHVRIHPAPPSPPRTMYSNPSALSSSSGFRTLAPSQVTSTFGSRMQPTTSSGFRNHIQRTAPPLRPLRIKDPPSRGIFPLRTPSPLKRLRSRFSQRSHPYVPIQP